MVVAAGETLISERKFLIKASATRLWQLIGGSIFDSLPGLESMEIIDENNWRAVLRVKLGVIRLNMNLKGEMVDMSPPKSIGVRLIGRSKGGILRLNQKVTIAFTPIDKDQTEVVCRSAGEGVGPFFKLFLLGRARGFAQNTFTGIENRLKYLTT